MSTGNQETIAISAVSLKQRTHTTCTGTPIGNDTSIVVTDLTNTMGSVFASFPNASGYRVLLARGESEEEVVYVRGVTYAPDTLLLFGAVVNNHAANPTVELMADVLTTLPLTDEHTGSVAYGNRRERSPTSDVQGAEYLVPHIESITVLDNTDYPATGDLFINFSNTAKGVKAKTTSALAYGSLYVWIPDSSIFPSNFPYTVTVGVGDNAEVVKIRSKGPGRLNLESGTFMRYIHPIGTQVTFNTPGEHQQFPVNPASIKMRKHTSEELVTYTSKPDINTFSFSSPLMLQFTHNPGETITLSLQESIPSIDGYDFPLYLPSDLAAQLSSLLDLVRAAGVKVEFISQR